MVFRRHVRVGDLAALFPGVGAGGSDYARGWEDVPLAQVVISTLELRDSEPPLKVDNTADRGSDQLESF